MRGVAAAAAKPAAALKKCRRDNEDMKSLLGVMSLHFPMRIW
jgi:hypothetical protein